MANNVRCVTTRTIVLVFGECPSLASTRNCALIFSCTCTSSTSVRSNHECRGSTFCCSFLRERERVHLSPHIPSNPASARWAPVQFAAHGASIARNFKNSRSMQSITEPRAFSPFSPRWSEPNSSRLAIRSLFESKIENRTL